MYKTINYTQNDITTCIYQWLGPHLSQNILIKEEDKLFKIEITH